MRIAVINPYGDGGVYSGPGVFAGRLFRALAADHDITLVLGRRDGESSDTSWARRCVPIMTFHTYGAAEQLRWSIRASMWLLRNAGDYDLIHIHGAAFFNLLPAAGAAYRRTRYALVALAAHNDLSAGSKVARIPGLARLRRILVSRASIGFALSDDITAEFVALGLPRDRVVALSNPVDTALFTPLSSGRPGTRTSNHTLGFVGILGPRKRPELVLDTLALVRDQGFRDAKAIFVGPFDNADYEWSFRAHASRLGLDGAIEMVGFTREVWRWTNEKMSMLIHPSSMEGLPGALVEAMASGLPAIVTDVGAMGRVVREADAGFVVPPEASVIAGRVTQLWRDEAMREKLSAAAREYACNHFDVSSVAEQYLGAVAPARPTQERNFAS